MIKRTWCAGAIASMVFASGAATAATTAELEQARDKAVAWLMQAQQPDGRWTTGAELDVHTTASVVQALAVSGYQKLPSYAMGVAWLMGAEARGTDALSRQVMALQAAGATATAQRLAASLQARRNTLDKGWGAYPGYLATLPDTPLALQALHATGTTVADTATLADMFDASRYTPSGGVPGKFWVHRLASNSSTQESQGERLLPTAHAMLALKAHGLSPASQAEAAQFLRAMQAGGGASQGGFAGADGLYWPIDTALAGEALAAHSPAGRADTAVQAALDFLKRTQEPSGAWGHAFATAAALRFVGTGLGAPVDSDADGIPDGVEVLRGTNPQVHNGKQPALDNQTWDSLATPGQAYFAFSGQRGVALSQVLTLPGLASCCTITSGSLPPGLSLGSQGAGLATLSGTPTTGGHYDAQVRYTTATGTQAFQLMLDILAQQPPTVLFSAGMEPFRHRADPDNYCATHPVYCALRGGAQAVVADLLGDGRWSAVAYFNPANELPPALNCAGCNSYTGPDWGQLLLFTSAAPGAWAQGGLTHLDGDILKFKGEVRSIQVIDIDHDGRKDVVLTLRDVATTSTGNPAMASGLPFRPVVVLKGTPGAAPGSVKLVDATAALGLQGVPAGPVAIVQANADGHPDLVIGGEGQAQKLYLYQPATGAYLHQATFAAAGTPGADPVALDLFQSAYPGKAAELVYLKPQAQGSGEVLLSAEIHARDAAGAYQRSAGLLPNGGDVFTHRQVQRVVPADMDGDLVPELVVFETVGTGTGAARAYAGGRVSILKLSGGAFSVAQVVQRRGPVGAVNRGGAVADIDNDGFLDIVVPGVQAAGQAADNVVYLNKGGYVFEKATEPGLRAEFTSQDAPVLWDANQDGALDVLWDPSDINWSLTRSPGVYWGAVRGNWVAVDIQGKPASPHALGTQLAFLDIDSGQPLLGHQVSSHHGSQPRVHLGLGARQAVRLKVTWPDGTEQTQDIGDVNRVVTITQP